jgi:hypothetical protein
MDIFGGPADSLRAMGFVQQLLAFLFVASYAFALGGLLDSTGRLRAWCFSALMAAGFVAMTRPWVHGALLVAFTVVALGLFIAAVWILSGVLSSIGQARPAAASEDALAGEPTPATQAAAPATGVSAPGDARAGAV